MDKHLKLHLKRNLTFPKKQPNLSDTVDGKDFLNKFFNHLPELKEIKRQKRIPRKKYIRRKI